MSKRELRGQMLTGLNAYGAKWIRELRKEVKDLIVSEVKPFVLLALRE